MSTLLLPFTLRSHHIFLDARINGLPATLVLDSGSGMCALDAEWARDLSLKAVPGGHAVGTDSMSISLATMDSLLLGDTVEFRNEPAALVSLRDVSARLGRTIHGTVGCGFFMKYVVEVDYAARVLRLYDPATFAYDGPGARLPIDLSMRVPILQAELVANNTTIPTRLVLDLGIGGYASVLTKPFVDRYLDALTARPCTERVLGTGVGGTVHGRVTMVEEMRLGTLRVPNPYVAIPAESRGFSP